MPFNLKNLSIRLLSMLAHLEWEKAEDAQNYVDQNRPTTSLEGTGGMDIGNMNASSSMTSMDGYDLMKCYESLTDTPIEWQ